MDNKACDNGQPVSVTRKGKKKQVKGELDRMKQAEKKRKRLEKALATSAAIRAELEKKKLKKKEEQQRLDEEGAAIAEAVAMHVLVGDDTDDGRNTVLHRDGGFKPWGFSTCDTGPFISIQKANHRFPETQKYSPIGQLPNYQSARLQQTVKYSPIASHHQKANHQHWESGHGDLSCTYWPSGRDHYTPYTEPQGLGVTSLHNGLQRMHI